MCPHFTVMIPTLGPNNQGFGDNESDLGREILISPKGSVSGITEVSLPGS